eukprot:scaffold130400_cov63-Phaeocystis_antarctica.AAC.4
MVDSLSSEFGVYSSLHTATLAVFDLSRPLEAPSHAQNHRHHFVTCVPHQVKDGGLLSQRNHWNGKEQAAHDFSEVLVRWRHPQSDRRNKGQADLHLRDLREVIVRSFSVGLELHVHAEGDKADEEAPHELRVAAWV